MSPSDEAEPSAEEIVEVFRSTWSEILQGGSGFFARELFGSSGEHAWLVLAPEDGGGYEFRGIFPTPLAAEQHFRAEGWVFSLDPEARPPSPGEPDEELPSGRWDGYDDREVLALVSQDPI